MLKNLEIPPFNLDWMKDKVTALSSEVTKDLLVK